MAADDILERFRKLRTWGSSNGRRAPHKPLLALWAIGRCLAGQRRMAPFALVDRELARLLHRFGPRRKTTHTEYPFWRMRKDEVWQLDNPGKVTTSAKCDARRSSLIENNVRGGLLEDDYVAFQANPKIAWDVADMLIDAHFPQNYRDDILRATGLVGHTDEPQRPGEPAMEIRDERVEYELARRRKRYPAFRGAVLSAYSDQCAVCGLNIRLADAPIAVEAAHIHWFKDAGPSNVRNGLALCVLHHRLFDRGAFTVVADFRVIVAAQVDGTGFHDALGGFDRKRLRILPVRADLRPDRRYLSWHAKEVFRDPDAIRA